MLNFGNCFRTKEEAKDAIPRVKAALKGELKISAPNAENFQLDGKPLTYGEKALIRALRAAKIADVYPYDDSVIVYKDGEGALITDSYLVAFSIAITEGGRSALLESLSATCTALNQIQAEQEEHNENQ